MTLGKLRKGEDGAAAVEFALIMIPLLMIVLGVVEFGLWLSAYQGMTAAAREGARVAATRSDVTGGSFASGTCTKGPDLTFNSDDIACTVQFATAFKITGTPTADKDCTTATLGQLVTVSWTQSFFATGLFPLKLPILPNTETIKGVFRCEAA